MDNSDSEYEIEEAVVLVELNGIIDANFLLEEQKPCKMLGLGTDKPILQLGHYIFTGEYEDTLGTVVVYEPTEADSKDDQQESSDKSHKFLCKTDKKLTMKRVFIQERDKECAENGLVMESSTQLSSKERVANESCEMQTKKDKCENEDIATRNLLQNSSTRSENLGQSLSERQTSASDHNSNIEQRSLLTSHSLSQTEVKGEPEMADTGVKRKSDDRDSPQSSYGTKTSETLKKQKQDENTIPKASSSHLLKETLKDSELSVHKDLEMSVQDVSHPLREDNEHNLDKVLEQPNPNVNDEGALNTFSDTNVMSQQRMVDSQVEFRVDLVQSSTDKGLSGSGDRSGVDCSSSEDLLITDVCQSSDLGESPYSPSGSEEGPSGSSRHGRITEQDGIVQQVTSCEVTQSQNDVRNVICDPFQEERDSNECEEYESMENQEIDYTDRGMPNEEILADRKLSSCEVTQSDNTDKDKDLQVECDVFSNESDVVEENASSSNILSSSRAASAEDIEYAREPIASEGSTSEISQSHKLESKSQAEEENDESLSDSRGDVCTQSTDPVQGPSGEEIRDLCQSSGDFARDSFESYSDAPDGNNSGCEVTQSNKPEADILYNSEAQMSNNECDNPNIIEVTVDDDDSVTKYMPGPSHSPRYQPRAAIQAQSRDACEVSQSVIEIAIEDDYDGNMQYSAGPSHVGNESSEGIQPQDKEACEVSQSIRSEENSLSFETSSPSSDGEDFYAQKIEENVGSESENSCPVSQSLRSRMGVFESTGDFDNNCASSADMTLHQSTSPGIQSSTSRNTLCEVSQSTRNEESNINSQQIEPSIDEQTEESNECEAIVDEELEEPFQESIPAGDVCESSDDVDVLILPPSDIPEVLPNISQDVCESSNDVNVLMLPPSGIPEISPNISQSVIHDSDDSEEDEYEPEEILNRGASNPILVNVSSSEDIYHSNEAMYSSSIVSDISQSSMRTSSQNIMSDSELLEYGMHLSGRASTSADSRTLSSNFRSLNTNTGFVESSTSSERQRGISISRTVSAQSRPSLLEVIVSSASDFRNSLIQDNSDKNEISFPEGSKEPSSVRQQPNDDSGQIPCQSSSTISVVPSMIDEVEVQRPASSDDGEVSVPPIRLESICSDQLIQSSDELQTMSDTQFHPETGNAEDEISSTPAHQEYSFSEPLDGSGQCSLIEGSSMIIADASLQQENYPLANDGLDPFAISNEAETLEQDRIQVIQVDPETYRRLTSTFGPLPTVDSGLLVQNYDIPANSGCSSTHVAESETYVCDDSYGLYEGSKSSSLCEVSESLTAEQDVPESFSREDKVSCSGREFLSSGARLQSPEQTESLDNSVSSYGNLMPTSSAGQELNLYATGGEFDDSEPNSLEATHFCVDEQIKAISSPGSPLDFSKAGPSQAQSSELLQNQTDGNIPEQFGLPSLSGRDGGELVSEISYASPSESVSVMLDPTFEQQSQFEVPDQILQEPENFSDDSRDGRTALNLSKK